MFSKKLGKKVYDDAKEAVKDAVENAENDKGIVSGVFKIIGLVALVAFGSAKASDHHESSGRTHVVVNNYYYEPPRRKERKRRK